MDADLGSMTCSMTALLYAENNFWGGSQKNIPGCLQYFGHDEL